MSEFRERVNEVIERYISRVREIRHLIHSNPELGHNEFKTSKFIREELAKTKVEVLPSLLKTDVIGLLNRGKGGKNVLLRADIDALPITEETECSYKSKNHGLMHACGHDGHTAILLGTAMVLSELKDFLNGSVKFVFQPAEETLGGGRDLVNAGVIENPKSDVAFAIHGWPKLEEGVLYCKDGAVTSACAIFTLKIVGKGGHSSAPQRSVDPINISAKIIEQFKQIPSECFSPLDSVLISVCKISSGTACNIIPDEALLEGSIRYFDLSNGEKIKERMEQAIKGICSVYGAKYEFSYNELYIPTINNKRIVDFSKEVITTYWNNNKWLDMQKPATGSEDFSFFLKNCPGAMFFLGLGENFSDVHTSKFDFNDNVIADGIKLFCFLTYECLLN